MILAHFGFWPHEDTIGYGVILGMGAVYAYAGAVTWWRGRRERQQRGRRNRQEAVRVKRLRTVLIVSTAYLVLWAGPTLAIILWWNIQEIARLFFEAETLGECLECNPLDPLPVIAAVGALAVIIFFIIMVVESLKRDDTTIPCPECEGRGGPGCDSHDKEGPR